MQGLVSHQPIGDGSARRSVSGLQLHRQERGMKCKRSMQRLYGKDHQLYMNYIFFVWLVQVCMYPSSCNHFQNLTMVLTMGPLGEDMLRRPRYWLRLFSVLSSTIQCEEIPPIILQVSSITPLDIMDFGMTTMP